MSELKFNQVEVLEFKADESKSNLLVASDDDVYTAVAKENGIEKKTLEEVSKFNEGYAEAMSKRMSDVAVDALKAGDEKDLMLQASFGTKKSEKMTAYVTKEKVGRIPGTDREYKKTVFKTQVSSTQFSMSKAALKRTEEDMYKRIFG